MGKKNLDKQNHFYNEQIKNYLQKSKTFTNKGFKGLRNGV